MFKRTIFSLALGTALIVAPFAHADVKTLTDDNSSVLIDPHTQAGMNTWTVDGVNHLRKQWFWYRTAAMTLERSIDTIPLTTEFASDTTGNTIFDTLRLVYTGAGFRIEIRFSLDGGAAASGGSDITESITIFNDTSNPLQISFFQYNDFELNGTAGNDTVTATNANTWTQFDGTTQVHEVVGTPAANHREAAIDPTIVTKLNDAALTTLNDSPVLGNSVGPGDVEFAWQWDFTIAANSSRQISKDKQIIPAPGAGLLAVIGLSAVSSLRRRLGA